MVIRNSQYPSSNYNILTERFIRRERDWVLAEFKNGRSPILIATDVASRGLGMCLFQLYGMTRLQRRARDAFQHTPSSISPGTCSGNPGSDRFKVCARYRVVLVHSVVRGDDFQFHFMEVLVAINFLRTFYDLFVNCSKVNGSDLDFGYLYSCARATLCLSMLSESVDHVLRAVWLCALERSASVFVTSDHMLTVISLFLFH